MTTRRGFLRMLAAIPLLGALPGRCESEAAAEERLTLLRTHVAGWRFHRGPGLEGGLRIGDELILRREPSNAHDPRAVAIHDGRGLRLGYLPRAANAVPAALLDQGVCLDARITSVELPPAPPWRRVEVEVLMRARSVASAV